MSSLELVRPVRFAEALAALHAGGAVMGLNRRAACLQTILSDLVGFRDPAGELVALAGFLPIDGGFEFWLELKSGARPYVARLVRLGRLTFDRLPHDARVIAHVRAGHRPGQRLARLCGFRLAGIQGEIERWELANGGDREDAERGRGA